MPAYPQAFAVESILAKRGIRVHTLEDPEIYQTWTVNQAIQKDWPKGTGKNVP